MTESGSDHSLKVQLERSKDEIVYRLTDRLLQKTGIQNITEKHQDFGWESHLNLLYQHFTEAIDQSDPQLFLEFLSWARTVQKSRNFDKETLDHILNLFESELRHTLGGSEGRKATGFLHEVTDKEPVATDETESFIQKEKKHGELAASYFRCLMNGDRQGAKRLIMDAVEEGVSVKDIYLHVFQPSQYEVGRLWQINEITVPQEHFCTAATQLIMSQLYTHIFSTERVGKRIVATTIGGDLHEIGIRMVSDFFEMEGWDTFYMGANSPSADVINEVITRDADMLAVSVTMTNLFGTAKELIESVKRHPQCRNVKILIGGRPFLNSDESWKNFGADAFARDAREAIEIANKLTSKK